jgi:SAM-dependent methyltransferase
MNHTFQIHIDYPIYQPLDEWFFLQGWIISDEPIHSIGLSNGPQFHLVARPDVENVYRHYQYITGFASHISKSFITNNVFILEIARASGLVYHNHILQNNALETEGEQLLRIQSENQYLRNQLQLCDHLPVPPETLRLRVEGWREVDHFLGVGRKIYWDICRWLQTIGLLPEQCQTVLDFGCGCGRVIRYWKLTADQRLYGSDIDPESIQWCQANLTHATFSVNQPFPPLDFPDHYFDLIYGISVFTHLPENMQDAWLAEIKRLLKPGAWLLTTVHGPELLPAEQSAIQTTLETKGFCYLPGAGTSGLPDFYQNTFHATSYIYQHWGQFLNIEAVHPRGINNHQNIVIAKRVGEG